MLIILAISVTVLLVLLSYGHSKLITSELYFRNAQISSSLKELARAADFVYSQSIGTTAEVKISIPTGVHEINIRNNHCFEYVFSTGASMSQMQECTLAPLEGAISKEKGSEIILINRGDFVQVNQR